MTLAHPNGLNKMLGPPRRGMGSGKRDEPSGQKFSWVAALVVSLLVLMPLLSAADSDFSWGGSQSPGGTQADIAKAHFQAPDKNGNNGGDWFRMAMLAILICLFANGVIFMLAKASKSPNAERWAVSEFYQVGASALMILVVVAGLTQAFAALQSSGISVCKTLADIGETMKRVIGK